MRTEDVKVVILCGGEGTRLREETEYKPKPMVTIGGMPILWHIMKIYSHYGFADFVLCLGYKGEMVKEFFQSSSMAKDAAWNVELADTGLKAMTGARIKRVEKRITGEFFLATYGDAVSTVDVGREMEFHMKGRCIATLAGVHPHSKFGLVKAGADGTVEKFREKPVLDDYVNGGFYVFNKEMFDYLSDDDGCVLETEPFARLVEKRKMAMYPHEGFWHSMDTYKDFLDLNRMWEEGRRPWKVWL